MGNNASKPPGEVQPSPAESKLPSRSSTQKGKSSSRHKASHNSHGDKKIAPPHSHSSPQTSPSSSYQAYSESNMGNQPSKQSDHQNGEKSSNPRATSLRVPHRGSDANRQKGPDTQFEPSGPPRDPEFIPHGNFGLPPRLPLPIGEELHTPGSPILDAQGSSALHEDEVDGLLPRQTSTESNNTLEEDELGNELRQYPPYEGRRGTVPTTIHWRHGGERVYVTGTFTGWSRKYRMNKE